MPRTLSRIKTRSRFKEIKEKEFKEVKEFKEIETKIPDKFKDGKDSIETGGIDVIRPIEQFLPASTGTTDDRIGRLEQLVAELVHFIAPQNRPDVQGAMFADEADMQQIQQQLQKNAADAKQLKESKDLEKTREL